MRANAMSGRWRGPNALKYRSTTASSPNSRPYAYARCSQASFVMP